VTKTNVAPSTWVAVDLGASSGRVMAGWLNAGVLVLDEAHRFENVPVDEAGSLRWNFEGLMHEIRTGLEKTFANANSDRRPVVSIGIDSWGVDFGLLDQGGKLTGPVTHYRDARTNGMMDEVFRAVPRDQVFESTGIQFMQLNTIYQLAALKKQEPDQLARAERFLMIADLVAWQLTGHLANEYTNATTTQLFDPRKNDWAWDLIDKIDLPRRIFHKPAQPGTAIGPLKAQLSAQWNADDAMVIAVATHDTGSAVAAVPALESPFAYLSCGTWSLLGTEVSKPVITPEALALNFTNEGGVNGTIRLLKNIMGLWILQECRNQWKREGRAYSWDAIATMAQEAPAFAAFIDVDDSSFLAPGDMPQRIREFCRKSGQSEPANDSAVIRCVLESLALRYRETLGQLEQLCGSALPKVHMVGGGVNNRLLCQWTADSCGRAVLAGPVEATALGNIGIQMVASGAVLSVGEMRETIGRSAKVEQFHPRRQSEWDKAFAKMAAMRMAQYR
jgi:rhamnulokinase